MKTATRTMTNAQMTWNFKKDFAWFEQDANGQVFDDWRMPIWTKDGGWLWNTDTQCYEMLL